MYAEVKDGAIARIGLRPKWTYDDGSPVDDDRLAQDGWLPILSEEPTHDSTTHAAIEKPSSEWLIEPSRVVVTWDIEPLPPPPVPAVVSMRQARLALLGAGLLSQVGNVIDGLEEPGRSAARIEWEYATELRRGHPLVAALGNALELTEQQVDDLFLAASEIG